MSINLREAHVHGPDLPDLSKIKPREKVWGHEYVIPGTEGYTTKIMLANPGSKISLHFHGFKNESWVLLQGELCVTYYTPDGDKISETLKHPLDTLVLPKCTPHTFIVPKDQPYPTIFIESSTVDDTRDSYRLSRSTDDYAEDDSSNRRPNS